MTSLARALQARQIDKPKPRQGPRPAVDPGTPEIARRFTVQPVLERTRKNLMRVRVVDGRPIDRLLHERHLSLEEHALLDRSRRLYEAGNLVRAPRQTYERGVSGSKDPERISTNQADAALKLSGLVTALGHDKEAWWITVVDERYGVRPDVLVRVCKKLDGFFDAWERNRRREDNVGAVSALLQMVYRQ